jgi:hypothetical protein
MPKIKAFKHDYINAYIGKMLRLFPLNNGSPVVIRQKRAFSKKKLAK